MLGNPLRPKNAGDDKGAGIDSKVYLNASGSTDADGNVTGWNWTLESGPSSPTLNGATQEEAWFTPDMEGDYEFSLKVQDDMGAWSLNTDTIIITAAANMPPNATISSPGDGTQWDGSGTGVSRWTRLRVSPPRGEKPPPTETPRLCCEESCRSDPR